ncbi:MAG: ABC transporter permease [Solobacterium sp.]|jgi:simple sugar transport system permease protein|nr:ABC transporter permease [Erysipelotrichaceae bacterium]MBQ1447511.1 ABC transporter permease [Solobacterium sp.]
MLSSIFGSLFTTRFLATVIRLSTPILFAAVASFIAASTGMVNIAIESIMTFGALAGILGSYLTGNAWAGLLIGLVVGILTALLIALFSMRLGASPILIGIALNTFADSLAIFFLYQIAGEKGTSASLPTKTLPVVDIPGIQNIPVLGQLLSGQYVLTYICWIVLILLFIMIYKTPLGMRMRACGLNANAARTAGINVEKLQIFSLVLSGMFAALGGMYLSLNYLRIFSKGMVAGQGWMGIAANGIANGNYGVLLLSALIFSAFRAVSIVFSSSTIFPVDLVAAIPYFAVFCFVTIASIIRYYRVKAGKVEEQ